MSFTRITVLPDQLGGLPCIRALRIPVATVVGMVADGMSEPEIVAAYPDLEAEDVREAIRYAAEAACKSGSAYGGSAAQERPNTRSADGPPFDVTE